MKKSSVCLERSGVISSKFGVICPNGFQVVPEVEVIFVDGFSLSIIFVIKMLKEDGESL